MAAPPEIPPAPNVTLIVAMDRRRAIGKDGAMPWHLPAELQHFKAETMGKSLLMGRKTHAVIGRPLPGRRNIVISRNSDYPAPGCELAGSLEEAIEKARSDEIMVIGGAQIYALALPLASRMVITRVAVQIAGTDVFFPEFDPDRWLQQILAEHSADARNRYAFRIVEYRRALERAV